MKSNAPKRKVFTDAVDLLMDEKEVITGSGIQMLPVNKIKSFHNHPFRLYEGERLADMVESVKEHGVLNPVIVRTINGEYEMLSGHNRQNAARLVGLKEIPAIVKENLPDNDAYVYVIETNMMQRSFTDLLPSEKAAVLEERYDKVLYQRKREEIVEELAKLEGQKTKVGQRVQHLSNRDALGEEYGLSGRSVARMMRINKLIPEFKELVDKNELPLTIAVDLSYLSEEKQKQVFEAADHAGIRISRHVAITVRSEDMTEEAIAEVVIGDKKEKNTLSSKSIKISQDKYERYFGKMKSNEINNIVEQALEAWFQRKGI